MYPQGYRPDRSAAGQPGETDVELLIRRGIERRQIDVHGAHVLEPVVGAGIELQKVELALQHGDARQKVLALQSVLVEVARRAVGGGDHHHTRLEQRLEQPPQDHRIGDVVDLELVEAQQPAIARQVAGQRR